MVQRLPDKRRREARPDIQLAQTLEASKAPAISRAVAVLRLLGRSETPLGVHAIARELGLVPSTCLYALRALAAEELVSFDADTKRYSLEAGILTLARHWLRHNQFANLVQPALDRLSRDHLATMLGVQIVGLEHIIVVAAAQPEQGFQLSVQIGARFPALISATGRCIAAFGDHADEDLAARFKTLRWNSAPSFEQWRAQVEETRKKGFAIDEGNYIAGVTVLAAPVWAAQGKLNHAIVALGIGGALAGKKLPALQKALLSSARSLSQQLGGDPLSAA